MTFGGVQRLLSGLITSDTARFHSSTYSNNRFPLTTRHLVEALHHRQYRGWQPRRPARAPEVEIEHILRSAVRSNSLVGRRTRALNSVARVGPTIRKSIQQKLLR